MNEKKFYLVLKVHPYDHTIIDRQLTQIFASPNIDECKNQARKHAKENPGIRYFLVEMKYDMHVKDVTETKYGE